MSYVKVEGESHLVRDEQSQAILNNNAEAYKMYKARRAKQKEGQTYNNEFNELKQEVAELKQLLLEIAQRVK